MLLWCLKERGKDLQSVIRILKSSKVANTKVTNERKEISNRNPLALCDDKFNPLPCFQNLLLICFFRDRSGRGSVWLENLRVWIFQKQAAEYQAVWSHFLTETFYLL